jgi:hypothetical protein
MSMECTYNKNVDMTFSVHDVFLYINICFRFIFVILMQKREKKHEKSLQINMERKTSILSHVMLQMKITLRV